MGERTKFLASDVLAFLAHTDMAVFLDNKEVVELTAKGVRIFTLKGKEVDAKSRKETKVAWELGSLSKASYAHYTLKEIHEQPNSVQSALAQDPEKVTRDRGQAEEREVGRLDGVRLVLPRRPSHADQACSRGEDEVRGGPLR